MTKVSLALVDEVERSCLVDVPFYAAVTKQEFDATEEAVVHLLRRGWRRPEPPNPLLDLTRLEPEIRTRARVGDLGPLLRFLRSPDGRLALLGPVFSGARVSEPRTAHHPGGTLGYFLEHASAETVLPVPEGWPFQHPTLGQVRRALLRELGRPTEQTTANSATYRGRSALSDPVRQAGLVSVVLIAGERWRPVRRTVRCVLDAATRGEADLEVLVVLNGSPISVTTELAATFAAEERVRFERLSQEISPAAARNRGFARSHGATVVFLGPVVDARPGWVQAMLGELERPDVAAVQPLLLRGDDLIHDAGLEVGPDGGPPAPVLSGRPPEDAVHAPAPPMISGETFAVSAGILTAAGGFDPSEEGDAHGIDVCRRLRGVQGGSFAVATAALVTIDVGDGASGGTDATEPDTPGRRRRPRPMGLVSGVTAGPGLRWGLKLPSTPGPLGDAWGDTHFAESLAQALRRRGQEVVSYRRGAHTSPATKLDHVSLALRGLTRIDPQPGAFNVLWVISHPDDVGPDELHGFDLVLVASTEWSETLARLSGHSVRPLLQAVDVDLLTEGGAAELTSDRRPVFVGANNPQRTRQAVLDAVAAGCNPQVYGPGWEGTPVWPFVAGEGFDHRRVMELYRQHGLVLADHWPDMRRNGFIANRVFQAVAAGAAVVTDDVAGIEGLFGGAVRVYRSLDELRELCRRAHERFPSREAREEIAARTVLAHSFDTRAGTLVDLVAETMNPRGALRDS